MKTPDFSTLRDEYINGLSLRELGEKYGVDKSSVRWKLIYYGFTDFRKELTERQKKDRGDQSRGRKHTEEAKQKIRESKLGKLNPNYKDAKLKGACLNCGSYLERPKCGREEVKFCNNKCQITYQKGPWNKGIPCPEDVKLKISKRLTGRKLSKEHIKKCLRRHEKSSLELKFEHIVDELGLPYRFVGNGELLINRKCPDFVHNNKPIVIEVFCREHKDKFRGGCDAWIKERKEEFNNAGYKVLFFNETKITHDNVRVLLGGIK